MKALKLFFLLLLLPVLSQAQNCSANPGGDRAICNCDPMLLFGEDSPDYMDPLDVTWKVVSTPMEVVFDDPNILQPTVSPVLGACFENGIYVFEMTVICVDSEPAVATLTVAVGAINTPPAILAPYTDQADICGLSVTVQGTPVDPGVTGLWLIEPDVGVTLTPSSDGSAVTIVREEDNTTACNYTLSYFQNIGSCEEVVSTEISFTQEYTELTISGTGNPCGRMATFSANIPGCNGIPIWYQPESQQAIATFIDSLGTFAIIEVEEDGIYEICYTILNGTCNSDTICEEVFIGGDGEIDLGMDTFFVDCQDIWTLDTYDFYIDPTAISGGAYFWTVTSNVPAPNNNWISGIPSGGASNVASLTFADISNTLPPEALPDGISVRVEARVVNDNGCSDRMNWFLYLAPRVSVPKPSVNLVCGGEPFFRIGDYFMLNEIEGQVTAEVLASANTALPIGSALTVFPNTTFDLSTEGFYSFLIKVSRTGIDILTGLEVTCFDESVLEVFVTDVTSINAGTDIETCLLSAQLNGSTPINADGNVADIPVSWELLSGQTGVLITSPDEENPLISGLAYGETYVFKYSFSSEPDCIREDEVRVTVLPEIDCPVCDLQTKVNLEECENGCVQVEVDGAETYLWVPADGVDDPTSPNPTICTSVEQIYTVYGYVNGKSCGSAEVEVLCEQAFDCDGFYVEQSCTTCSCGDPIIKLSLFDSNDHIVDDQSIDLTWTVYGQDYPNSTNPFLPNYEGTTIYSVRIEYNIGKEKCDTTIFGIATCLGDCPNFSLATCDELPNRESYKDCDGEGAYCDYGEGYLFVVDDLGRPVTDYFIDWGDGTTNGVNPNWVSTPECGTYEVKVWNFSGCDTIISYDPDCCNLSAPMVACDFSKEVPRIRWPELCGSAYYEVEMICLNGNVNTEVVTISQIEKDGYYYYTPDFSVICDFWGYRVVGICESTKTHGNYSDCIFIDAQGNCFEDDYLCELTFGTREQARQAEILNQLDLAKASKLYPNPVKGEEVYLNIGQQISVKYAEVEVRILGLDGKIFSSHLFSTSNDRSVISTTELPTGLYFVSIYSRDGALLESKRLVKSQE